MRTSNPILSSNAFDVPNWDQLGGPAAATSPRAMTVQGTVNAAFILITLTLGSAIGGWYLVQNSIVSPAAVFIPGLVGGGIAALIMFFSHRSAVFLSPVYAVFKGALLGALSLLVEEQLRRKIGSAADGLVFQAVMLTFGIFVSLLLAYKFRLVRVGGTLATCVMVATAGVALLYTASLLMQMFGVGSIRFIHSNSPMGIGFTAVVVVLASLNLVMDFQFVEEAAERGSPKYMEWYAAFGVLATLIWLYIEVLRLLSKIASRKS